MFSHVVVVLVGLRVFIYIIDWSVFVLFCPSVCMSVHSSISLSVSVHLFVCLSLSLYIYIYISLSHTLYAGHCSGYCSIYFTLFPSPLFLTHTPILVPISPLPLLTGSQSQTPIPRIPLHSTHERRCLAGSQCPPCSLQRGIQLHRLQLERCQRDGKIWVR